MAAQRGNDWDETMDNLEDEEIRMIKLAELRGRRKALEESLPHDQTSD